MVKVGQRWLYEHKNHRVIMEILSIDLSIEGQVVQIFKSDSRYLGEITDGWTLEMDAVSYQKKTNSDGDEMSWTLLEGQEAPR